MSVYAKNTLEVTDQSSPWPQLFALIKDGSRVLDIGCSSGNFGKELIKQKHCYVVGVDINEADLKLAAKHLSRAVKIDIEREPLDGLGAFDYVVMSDIIEHVIDPKNVLKKVKRLLGKNGRLVFSVPNMANIATRIELLGGRFEYTQYGLLDETHLHYYDRIELEKVLASAGFKIEHYSNTIRDLPRRVLTEELKKLGLSANEQFIKMAEGQDAITFQFIGVARPLAQPLSRQSVELKTKIPHDFMSGQFDALYDKLTKAEQAKAKLQVENKELRKQQHATSAELNTIKSSKGWRMLQRLHGAKHRFNSALRRK